MGKLEGILDYLITQDVHISGISVDGISFADKPEKSVVYNIYVMSKCILWGGFPGTSKMWPNLFIF